MLEGEEPPEEEPEEEEELDDDGNPVAPKKSLKLNFDWHSKSGIKKNIKKLCAEFNTTRALKPNRILIQGPPSSGRTTYAKMLSRFYNIPHVTIQEVVEACKQRTDEFGEEIKAHLDEQKEALLEIEREKLEKLRS